MTYVFSQFLKLIALSVTCFICLSLMFVPLVRAEAVDVKIEYWIEKMQPSVLSKAEMRKELEWFKQASKDFRGKTIKSVAEDIKTHHWERDVLAQAFFDITGIKVEHKVIGEGAVVEALLRQMSSGKNRYDIYVNDADLVGTHLRTNGVVNLTDYMAHEGRAYTNPRLDLKDFLNLEFGQDYDGSQLQLPDQQFANLYWFRYDWFSRADIKAKFRLYSIEKYGVEGAYDLGVPLNWAAYEDIAEFFTNTLIDGKKVYGHLDYGKKSPSLGWRFTDSWLSIAGVGDKGLPNGIPVDEWGIRVENRVPVGSSVRRGGATNGPAAVYALTKYIEWLEKYAPPESKDWRWFDAGPKAARGDIAQRIFQYITWLSDDDFTRPDSKMLDSQGKPVWRVAPTPHGRYWEEGMKVGYQDAGSWTIPKSVRGQKRSAAWLWAQFCVSKSVSLKKFLIGGTPIRKSTLESEYVQKHKQNWGGMIDFYTSGEEKRWTDSGLNVPHYPLLSRIWWPYLDRAIKGQLTPQEAMDAIARAQDRQMSKMKLVKYSPQLNVLRERSYWLNRQGAPKAHRERQKPKTMSYEDLLKQWQQ
ncbi:ABC transporter substrate-binding protein ['Osedax' symbiont bacterium Rs2_46_30_T18]|nr:ABC transporter substrate-binding protein ['Osedax' symbiont bacterium Rs2_46_30_T18]